MPEGGNGAAAPEERPVVLPERIERYQSSYDEQEEQKRVCMLKHPPFKPAQLLPLRELLFSSVYPAHGEYSITLIVDPRGIEPLTSSMPWMRSTK